MVLLSLQCSGNQLLMTQLSGRPTQPEQNVLQAQTKIKHLMGDKNNETEQSLRTKLSKSQLTTYNILIAHNFYTETHFNIRLNNVVVVLYWKARTHLLGSIF